MADSKVEIQISANADEAKRTLADLESAADRAMDAGANSAKKLAKSLDGVSESAKISAREIKGVVAGMASMAAGVASSALKANGNEKAASYLGGASSGAVQGAGMLAPLGPIAMLLGAGGGAILGALKTDYERDAQGKAEAAAMRELAESLEKARERMAEAKERADGFAATIGRLGDASRSASEREAERAAEIEKRQRAAADATERMAAAEKALREQAARIDGPQTEAQKKAADRLREAWADANQDLQTANGEIERLKNLSIESAKVEKAAQPTDQRGDGPKLSSLEKLGANFGTATDNLMSQGNRIAEEQLAVLREISEKTGNPPTWA